MEDRCICCGNVVPEGTMVCPDCLAKTALKEDTAKPKEENVSEYKK
ncbi:MAG: hypothetical protein ACI4MT_06100 [Christensenellales bacterium]